MEEGITSDGASLPAGKDALLSHKNGLPFYLDNDSIKYDDGCMRADGRFFIGKWGNMPLERHNIYASGKFVPGGDYHDDGCPDRDLPVWSHCLGRDYFNADGSWSFILAIWGLCALSAGHRGDERILPEGNPRFFIQTLGIGRSGDLVRRSHGGGRHFVLQA